MTDRMPPIPAERLTPGQRAVSDELVSGPRGALAGPFVPLLRSPGLMARVQKVGEYLRFESARDSGLGLAVAYFKDLESIAGWKANRSHAAAQSKGRESWYSAYTVRVARVERAYGFERNA